MILRHNNPMKGGLQRVCDNLAYGFNAKGYETYSISSIIEGNTHYKASFSFQGNSIKEKSAYIESIVKELNINIIINANVDEYITNDLLLPLKGKLLIIGHYHNSPFGKSSWLTPLNKYQFAQNYSFRVISYYLQRYRYKAKRARMIDSVDCMVLLSDLYKPELTHLVYGADIKMYGIPNPFPYVESKAYSKEKLVIFVGRISDQQKRIHSLLNIWKRVSKALPDWHFCLIGGGDELEFWKKKSQQMGLSNIDFMGFADSSDYYARARFLMMTSNFEGFPMTIVEAMQYGCIPIVFDSFAAVHDVIDNGKNGIIIPKFAEKKFAEAIVSLSTEPKICDEMGRNAQGSVANYAIDKIINKWEEIFDEFNV